MNFVGIFSASILAVLPGCWISFLLPLTGLSFLTRIFFGFTFTPLVLYAEFLSIRLIGISFESSTWILVLVNLPPLILVFHRWLGLQKMPQVKPVALCMAIYLLTIFLYSINFGQEEIRINRGGHLWLRADIIYSLASGDLPPEERQIAGLRVAYPWPFYVQQALISYWLNSAHLSSYIWVNALWLLAVSFFALQIIRQFSSSPTSKAFGLIFLYFGVNFVGFILTSIFPVSVGPWGNTLWGDGRYSPWLIKFFNSTPMVPGLCSVIALLYTLTQMKERYVDWSLLLVVLLISTGIIYPLLLPAASAFVCARIAVIWGEWFFLKGKSPSPQLFNLFVVLCVGIAFSFFHLEYIIQDRTQGGMIHLSSIFGMGRKLIEDSIVLSVLLIGCIFTFHRCWKTARPLTLLLLLGAASCIFLNVVLAIPGYRNEYKYIFPAAMCLFPFPALALGNKLSNQKLLTTPLLLFLYFTLASPLFFVMPDWRIIFSEQPNLDVWGFHVRLAKDEPLAPVIEAIRELTPNDTIVLLDHWDFYWPTLTQRSMYIAPATKKFLLGTNIYTDLQLIEAGGYSKELIKRRRAIVDNLYFESSNQKRMESLREILRLNRPVVIILDLDRHHEFLDWLQSNSIGNTLIENKRTLAWQITKGDGEIIKK